MEQEKIHSVAVALSHWFMDADSKPSAIFRLVKGDAALSVCLMKGPVPSSEVAWKEMKLGTTVQLTQMVLRVVAPGQPLQVSYLLDPEDSVHRERLFDTATLILQRMSVITVRKLHEALKRGEGEAA